MEDLTLALITLTSFVLLFVVAIFADRAGLDAEDGLVREGVRAASEEPAPATAAVARRADVA